MAEFDCYASCFACSLQNVRCSGVSIRSFMAMYMQRAVRPTIDDPTRESDRDVGTGHGREVRCQGEFSSRRASYLKSVGDNKHPVSKTGTGRFRSA